MTENDRHTTPKRLEEWDARIGELLRLTGRRPPVPLDDAERIKAAVRAHWRSVVDRGTRRRRVLWTAALATAATAAAVVGLAIWRQTTTLPGNGVVARVEAVSGSSTSVRPGDALKGGSELATRDLSRLAIRLTSGHSVRLDVDTTLRVVSDRAVVLDRGAVYVDSRGPSGRAEQPVEIRTPLGTIQDFGTQFEVRIMDASVRVRVREGAVSVEHRGDRLDVADGRELEMHENGLSETRELAGFGAEWAWVGEITPRMEIDGRSLREFLDWFARERGLLLRFESPELAASAAETTLSGSIDGMTLDQAIESVLLTCRMRHRVERDTILVGSL